jgi:hypothetical protein
VLRDLQTTRRRHEGAGGGDIDAVAAVTAGTDDIRKLIVRARERGGIFQQAVAAPAISCGLSPRTFMLTSAAASCSGFSSPRTTAEKS